MVRLFAFAALVAAGGPALAHQEPVGWASDDRAHAVGASHRHGRAYVYFVNERWGPRVFSRDDGYFQGRGGGVEVANGEAMFDYDRDYPYDFPSGWGAGEAPMDYLGAELRQEPACSMEPVRDRRTGRSAEIRICR